jgi:hypothetical protein
LITAHTFSAITIEMISLDMFDYPSVLPVPAKAIRDGYLASCYLHIMTESLNRHAVGE